MKKIIATSLALIPLTVWIGPAFAITPDQAYSGGAYQIKADYAWSKGAIGTGVTVAVVDTGVYAHADLAGRLLRGATFVSGTTTSNDDNGHGTHVAGIIAAGLNNFGIVGVAYNSTILPVKVLASNGSGWSTAFDQGMAWTGGKARIINLSLGSSGFFGETGMRTAIRNGQLVVAAAGNSGAANPGWPARYAKETWANGQVIAVGAVDKNNNIASFSNRAGDTAKWYVVAPGVNIVSLYNTGPYSYAYMSGTSMATPYVSGAAATIMSYWPYLTASQVASILFRTATDLGAPGVDAVYGNGLVNLQKALQPVGTTTVQTGTSSTAASRNVVGTTLSVANSPYGAAVKRAASAGSFKVVSTDDYGRGFETDLGAAVNTSGVPFVERMLGGMEARQGLIERSLGDAKLAVRYEARSLQPNMGFSGDDVTRPAMASFAFQQNFANGGEAAIGWGGMANRYFGLSASGLAPVGFASDRFSVPYLNYMQDQGHIGYGMALNDTIKVRLGVASAPNANVARYGWSALSAIPLTQNQGGPSMTMMEMQKSFERGVMLLSAGRMREQNALLGSSSAEALQLSAAPTTTFVSLGGAYTIARDVAISATATLGRTAAFSNPNSVISDFSQVTTGSWSLGLAKKNTLREKDALGLAVSMPVKPLSGSMGLASAVAQNPDGSLAFASRRVSLVPTATEIATELSYSTPVGKTGSLAGGVAYRLHPNHDADAVPEKAIGVRYQVAF